MRNVTEEDLILLYYGEHEDPTLASRVADSEALSARFAALCAELERADAWQPPPRGDDYGAEVWQRMAPHLATPQAGSGGFRAWLASFGEPRFSLAGVLGLLLVALVAFLLGREGSAPGADGPGGGVPLPEWAVDIDPARLLTRSVSDHLEQVDLILTEFANSVEPTAFDADWATDRLVANRLYRQAAEARGDGQLSAFLGELEPLLIELAYAAQSAPAASRERMQAEIRDGLLFRVRVFNQQLKTSGIST